MIDHIELINSIRTRDVREIPKIQLRFKLLENEGNSPGRAGETTPDEPIYKCCGKYPNRIPFQFRSSEGEERRCCEGKYLFGGILYEEVFLSINGIDSIP